MSRHDLASDLPLLFELEPATGQLRNARDPRDPGGRFSDVVALLHPQDRPILTDAVAQAVRYSLARFQVDVRLMQADGSSLPVLIFASAVERSLGQPRRYLCAITDNSAHAAAIERFDEASHVSTDVVVILDFDANEHWWSAAFTRVFGHLPPEVSDPVSRWSGLIHPSDRARVQTGLETALAQGQERWQDEYRLRRADGSYARVVDRARFFRRADGSVGRSISALSDVSELRDMAELLQLTAEAAQDVIYSHDLRAGTLWLNEAFQTRYGHDPALFSRDPHRWTDLIFPADRPGFLLLMEEALRGTAPRFDLRYRLARADGSFRAVIDRGRITRDETGRPMKVVGTVVDVTALRDEEERLRAVVEVAAHSVYEFDVVAGSYTYVHGMLKTFGHDWSQPGRVLDQWRAHVHPEDLAQAAETFYRFVGSAERYGRLDYRLARADGSYARVCERMIALRDDKGKALRVVGGMEDVTAEYEAQERLRQSQKLEAIGQLTGGVAHDFNNLLTVIIGSAGLLEAAEGLKPELRDLARNVSYAARRGAELTSGLLSFARQQPLTPRALALVEVFAELEGLLRRTLPAHIALTLRAPRDLWLVEADPAQLNAALLNLCVNAADAMARGGRITLEARNLVIDPSGPQEPAPGQGAAIAPGDYLRLDITDTGHGMTPEVLGRAFDPFFTTKDLGKGSGLGLSMVWGFAKQSGGHARIYSEPGIGTTVSLLLPRSRKDPVAAQPLASAPLAPGRGQLILVVEDDPVLRRFVLGLIDRLGYRAIEAETGEAGLDLLRQTPDVALVFSDLVMPGHMSGKDLARHAAAEFPHVPVLLTSGYAEGAILQDGRLEAGVHFLAKPYQLRDLGAKLAEVLALSAAGTAAR